MITIFKQILNNVLLYIDDILLFSLDTQSHIQLFHHFRGIIQQYGIMLVAKKIVIATT